MLALKSLARLIQGLLMLAIGLVGLGVAGYCLSGLISLGSVRPDRLVHLPTVRRHVDHYLAQLTAPGSTATLALAGGVVVALVGLLLLLGLLGSRRERLLCVEPDSGEGGLYARTRPVAQMAREETARAPGVTGTRRAKVKLRRSGRHGRLKIRGSRGPDPELAVVDDAVHARIDPFAESLHLKPSVRIKLDEPEESDVRA